MLSDNDRTDQTESVHQEQAMRQVSPAHIREPKATLGQVPLALS